ncbi:MAG: chaperone modulator CbpM [Gaiellaceae bacterium]
MTSAVRPVGARLVLREPRMGGPLGVEALAREAGVHPELVRRLVALGVIEPSSGAQARQRFPRDTASRIARALRLRRDLGLNYAGALLACELLDRIEQLEEQLRAHEPVDRRRR